MFLISFELLVVLSIIFLIGLGLWNLFKGKKGSWTPTTIKEVFNRPEFNRGRFEPITESHVKDSKGEIICRQVLERIYGKPFKKARPRWLNNSVTNNSLELDCFNEELRLAVEYQGEQHYKFNKFFHRSHDAFLNGKYRDEMKRRICKERGITLIEIPYWIKPDNIEAYLRGQLLMYYKK
jgi:hypothetical protein